MSESPTAAPEGAASPARSGPKGVVLIGALVGSLLLGAAGGVLAVGPMVARSSGYVVKAHAPGSAGADADAALEEGDHGGPGKADGNAGAAANLHLIDNLVLNPAGSGGSRFLMLAAALDLREAAQLDELKARDAEARDVVLRVMGARTVEELADLPTREALKLELADSVSALLRKKQSVRRVFFPQFVIQ